MMAVPVQPEPCRAREHDGKRSHFTRRTARRMARRTDHNVHEYRCAVCGLWHVGHKR